MKSSMIINAVLLFAKQQLCNLVTGKYLDGIPSNDVCAAARVHVPLE